MTMQLHIVSLLCNTAMYIYMYIHVHVHLYVHAIEVHAYVLHAIEVHVHACIINYACHCCTCMYMPLYTCHCYTCIYMPIAIFQKEVVTVQLKIYVIVRLPHVTDYMW